MGINKDLICTAVGDGSHTTLPMELYILIETMEQFIYSESKQIQVQHMHDRALVKYDSFTSVRSEYQVLCTSEITVTFLCLILHSQVQSGGGYK
jgi:hypothetical protein